MIVNSGSVRLDLNVTIDGLTLTGGSIDAVLSQSLVVNKAMAWTSGTVGDFVAVTAKGDVTIGPGALPPILKGTLNNEKSATLAGTLRVGGALSQVANAGTFTLKDDAGLELTEASASFRFDNTGSFAKPGGTGTSKVVGFFANKGGTVELKSGTLDIDFFRQEKGTTTLTKGSTLVSANDLNFFSGQLGGLGTVKGPNVINGGKLKAALANNAKLAVVSSLTLSDFSPQTISTFDSTVGGPWSPFDYASLVDVSGDVLLGGMLRVEVWPGYVPRNDFEYDILTTEGALSGHFTNVLDGERVTTIDGAGSFLVHYGSTSFEHQVSLLDFQPTNGVVAAPTTLTLVLIGGALLGARRVMRRQSSC